MSDKTQRLESILRDVNISYTKLQYTLKHGDSYEILACKYHFTKGAFLYFLNKFSSVTTTQHRTLLLDRICSYKDEVIHLEELISKVKIPTVDIRLS